MPDRSLYPKKRPRKTAVGTNEIAAMKMRRQGWGNSPAPMGTLRQRTPITANSSGQGGGPFNRGMARVRYIQSLRKKKKV